MCRPLLHALIVLAPLSVVPVSKAEARPEATEKPNFLWIVTEDIGCDMGCYGTKGVHTPNLDQLAAEGILYTRAYTTASVCSPSRSSFMTGLYPHQVFSKNMRIRPPLEKKPLPDGVDVFTAYLRAAGSFIGFPGHGKKDWGFQDPSTNPYDSTDWEEVASKQPFFCQYQFYDTHRVNQKREDGKVYPFLACPDHPVDRKAVELHPYTPETSAAREELAAYLENVNLLDQKIGSLLEDLKSRGLYENTIILVMGDNGPPVFRGKGFLYERGILMPLIVRIPQKFKPEFKPGTRSNELVSALDIAPTFIDLAGGTLPGYLEGRIFLGPDRQSEPEYLFAMRDRIDMRVDRCRSVCSKEFKYIRNYVRGITCFESSHGNVAASRAGEQLFKEGQLSSTQSAYYLEKPEEELYNLRLDPYELNNLAHNPAHQKTLDSFRHTLHQWTERTADDGTFEDPGALAEMDRRFNQQKVRSRKK